MLYHRILAPFLSDDSFYTDELKTLKEQAALQAFPLKNREHAAGKIMSRELELNDRKRERV